MHDHLNLIRSMRRSGLQNYIVPGLLSSLVGGAETGAVRLFEASREQHTDITPHSHRFDFACLVLRGSVVNRLWCQGDEGELYVASTLIYGGEPGSYRQKPETESTYWGHRDYRYAVGEWYSMKAEEIHSIKFSADAMVLFFEGPQQANTTRILEPSVDGHRVQTFMVAPWMFEASHG